MRGFARWSDLVAHVQKMALRALYACGWPAAEWIS